MPEKGPFANNIEYFCGDFIWYARNVKESLLINGCKEGMRTFATEARICEAPPALKGGGSVRRPAT